MREELKYLLYVFAVSVWATLCFIVPDFIDNPISDWKGIITLIIYIFALGVMQFLILYIICLNRWVCIILLPIYAIGGSIISYYRVIYNATITPVMVDVTLHTNMGTVAGVISWTLISWMIFNIVLSIGCVLYRQKYIQQKKQSVSYHLLGLFLLIVYYTFNSHLKHSINQRYPMNIITSISEYWQIERERNQERITPKVSKQRDSIKTDPIDLIVVIGESMRADHLSLNGYDRQTSPRLIKQNNVVSLPHIYSEYTHTAASVPHILTPADSITPEKAYYSSSFISCLSNQDYYTAWLSNQDYGRTYSAFISEADTTIFPNADKTVYVFHPWYDADLLTALDSLMRTRSECDTDKNLYVLHMIGSHWFYNNHVPENMQVFQPITMSRGAKQNSLEQLCNSYDNTALYLDYFLTELISRFEKRTAIVFYISDHGEALGENGAWLHANDAPATHCPAALVWYSDKYETIFPDKVYALKKNSTEHYRTDYFFHSVLSAVGLVTDEYCEDLDIFHINN